MGSYYYHNDHLGSARVITDKDGKVVEQYFYYPFGGGGPVGGPTFTGKELDDSGLFYFGARYYDPALGRFITPDPVQIPADNLYIYCANNPLTNIDPNGEFWQFIWAAWKFYTAARTLYNIYEAYQYGGWDAALMSAGSSWMLNQFSAGIGKSINFGDWGGGFGDVLEWGVEGAIYGGIEAAMYGGDFWEGARTGAISGVGSRIANALLPILGAVPTPEEEAIISDPVDPTDFLGAGKIVVGGIKTVLVGGSKVIGKIGTKVIGKGTTEIGKITAEKTIAKGHGIKDIKRLKETYGGKNWKKKKGIAYAKDESGRIRKAEVHWYEAHGVGKVEYKVKRWLEE
ncbi:MAG: RHS repeat-associated core domain-containing protein [bacterium]